MGFQDQLSLNAGQKYCRMPQGSILQYFRPALSNHMDIRPLFCLFLSGSLRQISLYVQKPNQQITESSLSAQRKFESLFTH